jgi:hypothetical protein
VKKLTAVRALATFVISWAVCAAAVAALQFALWPADELACRSQLRALTAAIKVHNAQNPSRVLKADDDVPQDMLDRLKIQVKDAAGKEVHYYFLAPAPRGGWLVKCNTHVINPMSLELLGVTILAAVAALLFLAMRGYTLQPTPPPPDGSRGPGA